MKALGLIYMHLLILTFSLVHSIRVNKVLAKVSDYLSCYLERVSSIRLVLSI